MGVLRKQGLYSIGLVYVGYLVGAVNVFVMYPKIGTENFGLTRAIMEAGAFLMQFAMLATFSVMYKFYPYYRDHCKKGENDFIGLTIWVPALGFLLMGSAYFLFQNYFVQRFSARAALLVEYQYWLFPFTLGFLYFTIFKTHLNIRLNATLPTFLEDVGYKICMFLGVGSFLMGWISFTSLIAIISSYYLIATLPQIYFMWKRGEWQLRFKPSKVTRRLWKKMLAYGAYIYAGLLVGAIGAAIAPMLIASHYGLSSNAYLTIAMYIITLLTVPQKSLYGISISILSDAWKRKDRQTIENVYKKTALNMLVAGLMFFMAAWLVLDEVFALFPDPGYASTKYVILIMGIGKLYDMAAGVNNELLNTSNFWRFNFTTELILLVMLIPLNAWLVAEYGLMGTAWAALIPHVIYNTIRLIFIWQKFRLQPFTIQAGYALLGSIGLWFVLQWIPSIGTSAFDHLLTIIVKGGLYLVLFYLMVVFFGWSEDIRSFSQQLYRRIRSK